MKSPFFLEQVYFAHLSFGGVKVWESCWECRKKLTGKYKSLLHNVVNSRVWCTILTFNVTVVRPGTCRRQLVFLHVPQHCPGCGTLTQPWKAETKIQTSESFKYISSAVAYLHTCFHSLGQEQNGGLCTSSCAMNQIRFLKALFGVTHNSTRQLGTSSTKPIKNSKILMCFVHIRMQ